MDHAPIPDLPLDEWAESLAESEAELEAGLIVGADSVRCGLRDSIVRLEGRLMAEPAPHVTPRLR